jgi:DNA topoisomerase-1
VPARKKAKPEEAAPKKAPRARAKKPAADAAPVPTDAVAKPSLRRRKPAETGEIPAGTGKHDLVIVESPTKAKTINKYLGSNFRVVASYGHVRDLPRKKRKGEEIAGVRISEGWVPTYVVEDPDEKSGKGGFQRKTARQILAELKQEASKAKMVYLATDPDREGEAIAWHIADELKLDEARTRRITFNEITKTAVQNALAHPRDIDSNLVRAQEARRVLDRVVGYPLSNLLGRKVTRGLSAGRVQSVAVRLIVEREREIEAFKTEEYWKLTALLCPSELRASIAHAADPERSKIYAKKKDDNPDEDDKEESIADDKDVEQPAPDMPAIPKPPKDSFIALLDKWENQDVKITNEEQADKLSAALDGANWVITKLEQKDKAKRPNAPFTTSTLQMEANQRLRFSADRTMRTAQRLYEGVDLGSEGSVALITYMRTDSTRVSAEALTTVRQYIQATFGPNYLPAQPNAYKSGKSAQEAHEAIRPTDVQYTPQRVQPYLKPDEHKLYTLIYNRFVASQMTPAIDAVTDVEVTAGPGLFSAKGEIEKFDGFRKIWPAKHVDTQLPPLRQQQSLDRLDLFRSQHFTKPPNRFNEASLVKALEKEGIGRPSTYASIIETIQKRGYVKQEQRRFFATEVGKIVTDLLVKHFEQVMNLKFTSHIEDDLDLIENGKAEYVDVLNEFWGPFSAALATAEDAMPKMKGVETGEKCPKCGEPLVERYTKKTGKKFISCSGWKKDGTGCDYVKPAEGQPEAPKLTEEVKCPNCGKPMMQRFGPRGPFLGCSGYPECKTTMKITADGKAELTAKPTDYKCEKCGSPMVIREGRRGPFLACTGYPKCRNAKDVDAEGKLVKPVETGVACEKCGSPMIVRRGPRGPFLACSAYPKCRSSKPMTAELKEKLKDALPAAPPKKAEPQIDVAETCPQCGSPMKVRRGRTGPFLGCSKYPKCRGTMPANEELLEKIAAADGM